MENTSPLASLDVQSVSTPGPQFVSYTQRWAVLAAFCVFSASSAIHWIAFAPISITTAELFQVNDFAVNSLSACWMLTYTLLAPFGSKLVNRLGLRYGILLGNVLNTLGSIIRCFALVVPATPTAFWVLLWSGNAITSCGQLFILSAPPSIAARWFCDTQRGLSCALAALANALGIAIGFYLAGVVVTDADPQQFSTWMIINLVTAAVAGVMCVCFFKSSPPTPPSASAEKAINDAVKRTSTFTQPGSTTQARSNPLMDMMRCEGFLFLAFVYACVVGMLYSLATVLNAVLSTNYSEAETGRFGAIMIICGAIGSIPVGPLLDKYRCFKSATVLTSLAVCLSVACIQLANTPDNSLVLTLACAVFGLTTATMIPVGFESGVELSFPLPDEYSGTALMVVANIGGLVTLGMYSLVENADVYMWSVVGVLALSTVCALCMPRDYRRIAYEKAAQTTIVTPPVTLNSLAPTSPSTGSSEPCPNA